MKQIAIFVGDLSSEYQSKVANAIIKEAKNAGVNSNVFTNSGVYGANTFFSHGEKNIIHAPFWDDYDGVIVAGDTFGIDGMYEELAGLLEEVKCPVVCMRQKDIRFNNVLVDDYSAMCTMDLQSSVS